jgi:hypothetical protein
MRYLLVFLSLSIWAQDTLPRWVFTSDPHQFYEVSFPECLKDDDLSLSVERNKPRFLVVHLKKGWVPENWKETAFELKQLIITLKSSQPDMQIGFEGDNQTINELLALELAPYVDGYLFEDIPEIPDLDLTGKGWFRGKANYRNFITMITDAGAVGGYVALIDGLNHTRIIDEFLLAINKTGAGSMDVQPDILNMEKGDYQFFFDPGNSTYYLAYWIEVPEGMSEEDVLGHTLYFELKPDMETNVVFPEGSKTEVKNYGERLEVKTRPGPCLIRMKMKKPEFQVDNVRVQSKASVDPYELVVKNQVFKKIQAGEWRTLEADQDLNYRYQAPSGTTVDVTYRDRILWEKGKPIEHVRQKMFINGVVWPYEDLPELPLIQPEKVQTEPLVLDLDKSYTYQYAGEDVIGGYPTWKVRFKPDTEGNFFSGTVWIDQKTGAHRKIRAIQSGLKPPVVGNEITVFYDWAEIDGKKFWVQVREENLQVINVVGVRIPLQISSLRTSFTFDNPEFETEKEAFYQSDQLILRDTDKGFRYLKKKDGKRVISDQVFSKQKFVLGGVLYDPGMENPIPLVGFNYINLDFMKKGYQANFFIAGAINDIIISDNDFMGKSWDLTAELFTSAIYLADSVYRYGTEVKEEQVKKLTESLNLTLGMPMGPFFKAEANVASRYITFKEGKEMNEAFVLPSSHFENMAALKFYFNRGRIASSLEYSAFMRSTWEHWGFEESTDPLNDTWRKLQFDSSYAKKLKGFQTIQVSGRYLKGWDLDRFSSFGFGFFDNHVSGFGASGIEASQAVRLKLGYQRGVAELFQVGLSLDAARAWQDDLAGAVTTVDGSPVDFAGIGLSINMIGPWKSIIRLEAGYGLKADLDNEAGDFTGQFVFLKLF